MPRQQNKPTLSVVTDVGNWLKENKEQLLTVKPSELETVHQIREATGRQVSVVTLRALKTLVGVEWDAPIYGRVDAHELSRACASAVVDILKKLEMPIPKKLEDHLLTEAARKRAQTQSTATS